MSKRNTTWTEDDVRNLAARASTEVKRLNTTLLNPFRKLPAEKLAQDRTPSPRKMKSTEVEYSLILERQKQAGVIISYRFEGIRLKWGTDPKTGRAMWYKPDFLVKGEWGWLCIEVKGPHIWTKDMIRYKGCRAEWPEFDFEMWQRDKEGRWTKIL